MTVYSRYELLKAGRKPIGKPEAIWRDGRREFPVWNKTGSIPEGMMEPPDRLWDRYQCYVENTDYPDLFEDWVAR